MTNFMPISEAKGKLAEVVRDSDDGDVLLMRHGRPAAIVRSYRREQEILSHLEDLEDRLSVYEREGVTVDLEKLGVELGLK